MAPSVALRTAPQLLLIILPSIFLAFATVAVGLRFYTRKVAKQKYGLDDLAAFVALVLAYGLHITICVSVVYGGLGVSVKVTHASNLTVYLKTLIAAGSLWGTCVLAVQLSILNLYLRLFGVMRWHRMCCYVVMGLCCAWWIAFFGILMADCIPLRKLWTQNIPGKCVNQKTFCGSTGIAHIILDFIILVLPIPVIWNLKIARSRKVLISIILTLGVFATICSSLRIGCFVALVKVSESDLTLSSWMSYLFESLEVMTGILCLCLPTLPSLYAHVRSSRFGSYIKSLLNSRVSTSRLNSSPSNVWKARSKKYSRSSPESSGFHTMGHSDSHLVATTTANVEHDPSDIPLPDLAAHGTQVTKSWQVESHNAHNHV